LTLRPWNIDGLSSVSQSTDKKVFTILQLRLHERVIALKKEVEDQLKSNPTHIFDVELTYITSRGNWYYASWKGDEEKSGGIATNIGVHFFDMLHWIFGPVEHQKVHVRSHDRASGVLSFKNANVRWFLSINAATLPEAVVQNEGRIHRSLRFDQWSFDFTEGFTELHSRSYAHILNGEGFSERDAHAAIGIVHSMRESQISPLDSGAHPLASLPQDSHPFYPLKES
jgi:UDP-N-acetyl-2-amino-2-deoxyglucuronate dehydrogenase